MNMTVEEYRAMYDILTSIQVVQRPDGGAVFNMSRVMEVNGDARLLLHDLQRKFYEELVRMRIQ